MAVVHLCVISCVNLMCNVLSNLLYFSILPCPVYIPIHVCSDEKEEASKLLEEADMPLDKLLAHYMRGSDEQGQ